MFQRGYLNVHDFLVIGAIAVLVHFIATPLYKIVANSPDDNGN